MNFVRALVMVVVPFVVVAAQPIRAEAGCPDISWFPLAPGTTRTYQGATVSGTTPPRSWFTIKSVAGSVVKMQAKILSNPSGPVANGEITCVAPTTTTPGGIRFNFADVFTLPAGGSTPASVNLTPTGTSSGVTIPLPDFYAVGNSWIYSMTMVAAYGPMSVTMTVTEKHTIINSGQSVTTPAAPSGGWNNAWIIQVDSTNSATSVTGLPPGAPIPPFPTTTSTIYQWIVPDVGLVQFGKSLTSGPYTQLVSCAPSLTTSCPN